MERARNMLAPLLLATATLGAGCADSRQVIEGRRAVYAYSIGRYDAAVGVLRPLSDVPDENYVLNNLRLGSAALAQQDMTEAERAYLRAYGVMNATRVDSAGRQIAAVWFDEKAKIWRGEPYERAVANLHLGMIYYARGEFDNARGAFENALFKLRDYDDPKDKNRFSESESDFTVAAMMLGRTWLHLGRPDAAEPQFRRALELRPNLEPTVEAMRDLSNNVLLYVEFGFAPRKVQGDASTIAFYPSPAEAGALPEPRVIVDGQVYRTGYPVAPLFDTVRMAQDRRWQSIDTVRATKDVVGTGLMLAGAGTTLYGSNRGNSDTALVGLGMLAVGALLKGSSQADVRTWEMCPRTAYVIPMRLPPGEHEVTVEFPQIGGLRQTWANLAAPEQGEAAYLIRMSRATQGTYAFVREGDEDAPDDDRISGGRRDDVAGERP